jgi:hypothetical protein
VNIVVVSSMMRIATANYLVGALRRAGHTLMVLSDVPATAVDVVCGPAPDIARVCAARGFAANFAFFIEGGSMQLLPTGLERVACPTAWYAIDSHTGFSGHACIARLFDVTFVAHKQYVDRLWLEGAHQARWLPVAFPAELLVKSPRERVWDIAFVGSVDKRKYPRRAELLAKLVRACGRAAVGPADPREMIERYAAAKIVLNNSAHHDLNMRYFEAMGSGAVLLTDAAIGSGVEELFEPGRHFVQYRDEQDLESQFAALLGDPERRAAIGAAAQAIVLERHTYDHRVADIVARMHAARKVVWPKPYDYFAAFGELNMPGEALMAAANARMGQGSRIGTLNRGIGGALQLAGVAVRALIGAVRRLI